MHDKELSTGELYDVTQHQVALVIRVDSENSRHHVDVSGNSTTNLDVRSSNKVWYHKSTLLWRHIPGVEISSRNIFKITNKRNSPKLPQSAIITYNRLKIKAAFLIALWRQYMSMSGDVAFVSHLVCTDAVESWPLMGEDLFEVTWYINRYLPTQPAAEDLPADEEDLFQVTWRIELRPQTQTQQKTYPLVEKTCLKWRDALSSVPRHRRNMAESSQCRSSVPLMTLRKRTRSSDVVKVLDMDPNIVLINYRK